MGRRVRAQLNYKTCVSGSKYEENDLNRPTKRRVRQLYRYKPTNKFETFKRLIVRLDVY